MSDRWKEPPRPHNAERIFDEFPNIPSRRFERKDFRMLVKVFSEVFSEWEGIGVCLEVAYNVMKDLEDKWKNNSVRGLLTIVDAWLKGSYNSENLYPCWCSVVYVVADKMAGKNPAAAMTIAQNWKVYEDDPFRDCDVAKSADNAPLHKIPQAKQQKFLMELYTNHLHEVADRWFEIGVLLGVPLEKLKLIDKRDDKLLEVVKVWIGLYYEASCRYLPPPTMQILVDAVYHVMGGHNKGLAGRIAGQKVSVASANGHDSAPAPSTSQQTPPAPQTAASPSGGVGEFSASMTPEQLHDWLQAKQMSPADCKIIKDNNIGGAVFHHINEDAWKSFGISPVGLILLTKVLIKQETAAIPTAGHIQPQGQPVETPPPQHLVSQQTILTQALSHDTIPAQTSPNTNSTPNTITSSGKPTLPLFTSFPTSAGNRNLAEKIGVEYFNFGIQLLMDDIGSQTSAIEKACHERAEEINLKIFQKWLAGNGRQPLTWNTLVCVIQDIGLKALAQEIKQSYKS